MADRQEMFGSTRGFSGMADSMEHAKCGADRCCHGQVRREGERGGSFPRAPRHLGAPPSLKNTEKGVPNGFFLTSDMHKIQFRPGGGTPPRELTTLPRPLIGW